MELTSGYKSILGPPEACRAFIPHAIRNTDFQQLGRFADKHVLLEHRWVFADETEILEKSVIRNMQGVLHETGFYPASDYIVTGGDPILCSALLFLVVNFYPNTPVTLLRWDQKHGSYFPFRLG